MCGSEICMLCTFCFASCCPSGLWSLCHWNSWIDYHRLWSAFCGHGFWLRCSVWSGRSEQTFALFVWSWIFREFEMFIRFCCTSLMMLVLCCSLSWKFTVLSAALSVWHGCAPCVGLLLVLTDRLDLLSSSLHLPGALGMSSPGMIILGPPLAPSSGSGQESNLHYVFCLHLLSPSFMVQMSCADPGRADSGVYLLGWGTVSSCLPFWT